MTTTLQPATTPYLVWDTFNIILNQAKYLVETGEAADDEEGFNMACKNCDLLQIEWDYLAWFKNSVFWVTKTIESRPSKYEGIVETGEA